MSQSEAPNRSGPGLIKNPQDFWGALALLVIGFIALYAVRELPWLQGFRFTSGTTPRLFAYGMLICAAGILARSFVRPGPELEGENAWFIPVLIAASLAAMYLMTSPASLLFWAILIASLAVMCWGIFTYGLGADAFTWRGPTLITIAVFFFGIAIRPLGIFIAGFGAVMIASFSMRDATWLESIVFAALITGFCALLFPIALGQPVPLWPTLQF